MTYREPATQSDLLIAKARERSEWKQHAIAVAVVIAAIFAILGLSAAFTGALIWLAWTYAVVPIVGLPALSYWQACIVGMALSIILGNARGQTVVKAGER